jgi:hypothetical protein
MAGTRQHNKTELARARAAAARQKAEQARRRERAVRIGWGSAAVAVVAGLAVAVVAISQPQAAPTSAPSASGSAALGRTTAPPWDAPADPTAAVRAAGLAMLGEEGSAQHIHAHLDVIVNGQHVPVPADIGVDEANSKISPLHSHEGNGVIHIESPSKTDTFTLGQFFTEWQVSLGSDQLGGLRPDGTNHLTVNVNGKPATGNPAGIVLRAHDEIAVVYGTNAQQADFPVSYQWPAGL